MSESQAALNALCSYTFELGLFWEFLQVIIQLATENKIWLFWLPGHEEIPRNEEADRTAKEGAEANFVGSEPFFGVS